MSQRLAAALVGLSVLVSGLSTFGLSQEAWADGSVINLPMEAEGYVDNSGLNLNVYEDPSASSSLADVLPDGTALTVTGYTSDGWLAVEAAGYEAGFVQGKSVFVSVMSITADPEVSLTVGSQSLAEYEIYPPCATNQKVFWSTDNTSVLLVDTAGYVHALTSGTATVFVETDDGGFVASITYSVEGDPTTCSVVLTDPLEIPEQLTLGSTFALFGFVRSYGCLLATVTITIGSSPSFSQTIYPFAAALRLGRLTGMLPTELLGLGSHQVTVTAVDSFGRIWDLQDETFEVVAQTCQLTLSSATNVPSQHLVGKGLALQGIVSSVGCWISQVSAQILGTGSNEETSISETSFDLADWSESFDFSGLELGSYRFEVKATDSRGKVWLLQGSDFLVVNKQICTVTLVDPMAIPGAYDQGTNLFIAGTVKAEYCNLSKVSAKITKGKKVVYSGSVRTKAKSLNLNRWANKLHFSYLKAGTYKLTVKATNSKRKTKTLQSQAFVVLANPACKTYAKAKLRNDQMPVPSALVGKKTLAAFIGIALSQVGYVEGAYRGTSCINFSENNNWSKYGIERGWGKREVAWCAAFVSWVAKEAGIRGSVVPNYASVKTGANWFITKHRYHSRADILAGLYTPKAGDIVFFGADTSYSHTGIVLGWDGVNVLFTVEGNISNPNDPDLKEGVFRWTRPLDNPVMPVQGVGETF